MKPEACHYNITELASLTDEETAVRMYAYLDKHGGELRLTEHRDGSGAVVGVGEVVDRELAGLPIDWMVGHRVSVHGFYHPDTRLFEVHSIGWIAEEGIEPPRPPFRTVPSRQDPESN